MTRNDRLFEHRDATIRLMTEAGAVYFEVTGIGPRNGMTFGVEATDTKALAAARELIDLSLDHREAREMHREV